MLVNSLFNLSAKKVAQCFQEGRYEHLDITLSTPISDKVYSLLTDTDISDFSHSRVIAQKTGLKLKLTNIDDYSRFRVDMENLNHHNIQSLDLNLEKFHDVADYMIKTEEGGKHLDIVGIFKKCLNENSRTNLKFLFINAYEFLPKNWIELINEIIPNLQRLSCFWVKDAGDGMNGINLLRNLQVLSLRGCFFDSRRNLQQLFDLPNLRVIDVSHSEGFIKHLLLCHGTLKNLKFIACRNSDIDEDEVRELVSKHPSLEEIDVLETSCNIEDFSDLEITVINLANNRSILRALDYVLNRVTGYEKEGLTDRIMKRIEDVIRDDIPEGFEEDLFWRLMMKVERIFSESKIHFCQVRFLCHLYPDESSADILRILEDHQNNPLLVKRQWAAQMALKNLSWI